MQDNGSAGHGSPELRIHRMSALVNGIVYGLICGVVLFLMTAVLLVKGGPVVGPHLHLLGQYLPGYEVSWAGSFLGLLYGLFLGFIFGFAASWLYNLISRLHRWR
jgi:hypothetical protein